MLLLWCIGIQAILIDVMVARQNLLFKVYDPRLGIFELFQNALFLLTSCIQDVLCSVELVLSIHEFLLDSVQIKNHVVYRSDLR